MFPSICTWSLAPTVPTPKEYGPPNPPELHGNITPLENLLSHNPKAKIILGPCGFRQYRLPYARASRRLLQAHPNLYMEIKFDPGFQARIRRSLTENSSRNG